MANCDSTRTLNHETIASVRDALRIGLAGYGEIERLSAAQGIRARCGKKIKKELRVIHPTGMADTVQHGSRTLTLPSTVPSQLRILAALLAMPEDDALDLLRDMRPQAPWLGPSLPELGRIPLEHWQAEHTRLFISAYPRIPCPPYESAYRQGVMGGIFADELADLYRRAGLQALDVPADYLGTMLECAAYLKETGRDDLLRELMEEHLGRWVPRFARDLVDHAGLDFYRALGRQIGALVPESPDRE